MTARGQYGCETLVVIELIGAAIGEEAVAAREAAPPPAIGRYRCPGRAASLNQAAYLPSRQHRQHPW